MRLLRLLFLCLLLMPIAARAQIANTLPYLLQNGTIADATQVMANFNQIVNNVNANAAHNGTNNDITSLLALTQPPGGAAAIVFTATSTTGSTATAYVVGSTSPAGYQHRQGNRLTILASVSNTGALTLNANGIGAITVKKVSTAGLVALGGGEVVAGQVFEVFDDGTQFELITNDLTDPTRLVPSGAVMAFNLSACPAGWINSDGTSGTADARGVDVRGLDNGRGLDPGRTLASYQADQFQDHEHASPGYLYNGSSTVQTSGTATFATAPAGFGTPATSTTVTAGAGGTPRTGSETRGKNVALLYCQKS